MKDLADWRKRIDEIDQQLVKLLNERSLCAVEVGKIKKVLRLAAWQPEREAEILRNVVKSNPGPLDDAAIRRDLGYTEVVAPEEAYRRTVAWHRTASPPEFDPAEFDYEAEDRLLKDLGL